jgi:tripartite ATP-independent transporter DctM subunit
MPGGVVVMALVACSLLTAFTGASGVTIIALGGLLLPAFLKEGYGERFSLGLVTSGGSMGLLFAPSLPLIVYGVIASKITSAVTIEKLFVAGVAPGLLLIALLGIYGAVFGWWHGVKRTPFAWGELGKALWEARYELPLPFVVLGGVYGGKLVVSDAASVTAAYAVLSEVLIYREVRFRDLPAVMRDSVVLVGGILVILGLGMAITNFLVDQEVPQTIFQFVDQFVKDPLLFLIVLNVFLLVVGCMMDIYTAIIVIVPLIVPVALNYNIDPVHLGIIFLANLSIGFITPPVGMNLFIASIKFDRPVLKLCLAVLPFLLVLLVALVLITYIPQISLFALRFLPQARVIDPGAL